MEEKLGQMIMVGVDGHYLALDSDPMARLSRTWGAGVGGVILWQSDVDAAADTFNRLQGLAAFVAGCRGSSGVLPCGCGERPPFRMRWRSPRRVTRVGLSRRVVYGEGGEGYRCPPELCSGGRHHTNPSNPVINTRSFGEDTATVRKMVEADIRGSNAGGIIATAKHFPDGHGADSH